MPDELKENKQTLKELDSEIQESSDILETVKSSGWQIMLNKLKDIRVKYIVNFSTAKTDNERLITQSQYNVLDEIISFFTDLGVGNENKLEGNVEARKNIKESMDKYDKDIAEHEEEMRQSGQGSAI